MNQIELNRIATQCIESKSIDVARKLKRIPADDLDENI
jgi:hypothetical protein